MTTSYAKVEIPVDESSLIRATITVPDAVAPLLWAWMRRLSRQHLVGACELYTDEPAPKPKEKTDGSGVRSTE